MIPARDNPFSTDRVLRERYRFSEREWAQLQEKLAYHCGRGALVGPKGSGKTTLLEDLRTRLTRPGRRITLIRLSAEAPKLPRAFNTTFFARLDQNDAILLDGAEQLSWFKWFLFRWQSRHAGFVIVTTHRSGRLPLLHRCSTTPLLLRALVRALGEELPPTEAARLHRRHRGNIREALRELYDRHAEKDSATLSLPTSLV